MRSAEIPNLRRWSLPYTSFEGRRRGRWLKYSDTRRSTVFIDLDAWPPHPVVIDTEFVSSFDVLPDGRLVVCSMLTKPESDYMVRIHPVGWPAVPATGAPKVIPGPIPGPAASRLGRKPLLAGDAWPMENLQYLRSLPPALDECALLDQHDRLLAAVAEGTATIQGKGGMGRKD